MKTVRQDLRKGSHMTQLKGTTNLSVNEYYKNISNMRLSNASSKKEDFKGRIASHHVNSFNKGDLANAS